MILANPSMDVGGPIMTHEGLTQINDYVGSNKNDQPWIRTGPDDHVYIAYNDLGNFGAAGGGKTASVLVSTDGGKTSRPVIPGRNHASGRASRPFGGQR